MQEVQALCDRVIVINRGEIVADDKLDKILNRQSKSESIIVEFDQSVAMEEFIGIEGVDNVIHLDGFRYKLTAKEGLDIRPAVFRFAADKKLSLLGLRQEETSLEQIPFSSKRRARL